MNTKHNNKNQKRKVVEDYSPLLENQPPGILHALLELRDLQIISARFESFWRKYEISLVLFGLLNLFHSLYEVNYKFKILYSNLKRHELITYILVIFNFPMCLILALILGLITMIPFAIKGKEGISKACGCIPIYYNVLIFFNIFYLDFKLFLDLPYSYFQH